MSRDRYASAVRQTKCSMFDNIIMCFDSYISYSWILTTANHTAYKIQLSVKINNENDNQTVNKKRIFASATPTQPRSIRMIYGREVIHLLSWLLTTWIPSDRRIFTHLYQRWDKIFPPFSRPLVCSLWLSQSWSASVNIRVTHSLGENLLVLCHSLQVSRCQRSWPIHEARW